MNMAINKTITVLLLAGSMAGCSSLDVVHDKAEGSSDAYFKTVRDMYCDGQFVGAVRRYYSQDAGGLLGYLEGCGWGDTLKLLRGE